MRQIKFRAFDGNKMWQHAVPRLSPAHNGGMIEVSDRPDGVFNQFINGELMQFTGLYDKNGNPIYGGDVVKLMDCGDSLYKIIYNQDRYHYAFEKINPEKGDWIYDELENWDSNQIEIIGNIYEHQHLLEQQS